MSIAPGSMVWAELTSNSTGETASVDSFKIYGSYANNSMALYPEAVAGQSGAFVFRMPAVDVILNVVKLEAVTVGAGTNVTITDTESYKVLDEVPFTVTAPEGEDQTLKSITATLGESSGSPSTYTITKADGENEYIFRAFTPGNYTISATFETSAALSITTAFADDDITKAALAANVTYSADITINGITHIVDWRSSPTLSAHSGEEVRIVLRCSGGKYKNNATYAEGAPSVKTADDTDVTFTNIKNTQIIEFTMPESGVTITRSTVWSIVMHMNYEPFTYSGSDYEQSNYVTVCSAAPMGVGENSFTLVGAELPGSNTIRDFNDLGVEFNGEWEARGSDRNIPRTLYSRSPMLS